MFLSFFLIGYFLNNIIETSGHPKITSIRELNVILFFAENDATPKSHEGLMFLDMPEVARVKLSTRIPRKSYYVSERNAQNCEELLWDGLESLTHFCQNALGMKTATISVSSQGFTNDANAKEIDNKKDTPELPIIQYHEMPKHRQIGFEKDSDIPVLEKRTMNLITDPKHTEVFKIRVKRNDPEVSEKPIEIQDVPLGKDRNKPAWDVLDVMSHVRVSFFGKLFDNDKNQPPNALSNLLPNVVGEIKPDPGLFEMVKSTLSSLEDMHNPFLLVIFGGRISTIDDCNSALIQSIKHVMENTDPAKTLVVLSMGCHQEGQQKHESVVNIVEGGNHSNEAFPVFAKGPRCEKLTTVTQIYDIPLTVKSILEEFSPNFGDDKDQRSSNQRLLSDKPLKRVKRNSSSKTDNIFCMTAYFMLTFFYCIII